MGDRSGIAASCTASTSRSRRRRPPGPPRPPALDPRHRARGDGRHRRGRPHPLVQRRRRTPVRLPGRAGGRTERPHPDAGADASRTRRLPRSLPSDAGEAHHRDQPDRDGPAGRRFDIPDGDRHRRDALGRAGVLHRLRQRSDRASENPGPARRTPVRTRPRLAPERHGRDGLGPGARVEPAARRHRQLHQGLPSPARKGRAGGHRPVDRGSGQDRRASPAGRPDHSPPSGVRHPRRDGAEAGAGLAADRGGERPGPRRRREQGVVAHIRVAPA